MNRTNGPERRPTNKLPLCLKKEENNILVEMLGNNSYFLAAGVAQLIQLNSRRQWEKVDVGIVCFVKDYSDRGYFLRLFDLNRRMILFEQQLDENFQARCPDNERLLTFEGNTYVYELNFALVEEARAFKTSLDKYYDYQQKYKRRGLQSKKKQLSKSDIGLPTNFEHRVHVGWDPGKGLQSNAVNEDLDPSIKQLLENIGVANIKEEEKKFIYEFIDQHGGMDQLKKELHQQHQHPSPKK